jgi:anti-anti-sigma factor
MALAELSVTVAPTEPSSLVLTGELDLSTAAVLLAAVRGAAAGRGDVVLDLRSVTFMDSRGMLALLEAQRQLRGRDRELRLAAVSPPVRRVLEITQAWELFAHEPDVQSFA